MLNREESALEHLVVERRGGLRILGGSDGSRTEDNFKVGTRKGGNRLRKWKLENPNMNLRATGERLASRSSSTGPHITPERQ